jgi:hypothetical protein
MSMRLRTINHPPEIVADDMRRVVPTLIAAAGAKDRTGFLEFFTAHIRNPHTRLWPVLARTHHRLVNRRAADVVTPANDLNQ